MIEILIHWGYSEIKDLKKILTIQKNNFDKKVIACYLFGSEKCGKKSFMLGSNLFNKERSIL
jgi:hypothetical protein